MRQLTRKNNDVFSGGTVGIRYASWALIVLLASNGALPQKKTTRTAIKRTQTKTAQVKRSPNYQLSLKIVEGPKYFVSIVSPLRNGQISANDLGSLITDLPAGGNQFYRPNNVFPRVILEASPNITMLDLWNPITLFRRDRTDMTLALNVSHTDMGSAHKVSLIVPWKSEDLSLDVKPNPLLLVVTLSDDGKLFLNREPAGTLSDAAPLSKKLSEIFKSRELNGVLREGVNEIEKSVTIVMPMTHLRKVSDLIAIVRAVWEPGGDRISLVMDDPFPNVVDDREPLLPETLPTPSNIRPRKP